MFQFVLAALLQLSLGLLVEAAPVSAQGTNWQGPTGGGVVGFIVLILDIIAWGMYTVIKNLAERVLTVIQSRSSSPTARR
jgi:hypothetical protein